MLSPGRPHHAPAARAAGRPRPAARLRLVAGVKVLRAVVRAGGVRIGAAQRGLNVAGRAQAAGQPQPREAAGATAHQRGPARRARSGPPCTPPPSPRNAHLGVERQPALAHRVGQHNAQDLIHRRLLLAAQAGAPAELVIEVGADGRRVAQREAAARDGRRSAERRVRAVGAAAAGGQQRRRKPAPLGRGESAVHKVTTCTPSDIHAYCDTGMHACTRVYMRNYD